MAKERTDAERAERKAQKAKAKAEEAAAAAEEAKSSKKRSLSDDDNDDEDQSTSKKRKSDAHEQADDEEPVQHVEHVDPVVVAFAQPLANDKAKAKVFKAIRRATKHGTLKRGVKEITKATRKTAETLPGAYDKAPAVAIIAGDVFPEDVISHIPVHCEDKSIPFIFVNSRKELGEAGNTKRPTSCLLLLREKPGRKVGDAPDTKWDETFKSVHKLIVHERNKCSW